MIAARATTRTLKGRWDPRLMILIEFASTDRLLGFYDSPEYGPGGSSTTGRRRLRSSRLRVRKALAAGQIPASVGTWVGTRCEQIVSPAWHLVSARIPSEFSAVHGIPDGNRDCRPLGPTAYGTEGDRFESCLARSRNSREGKPGGRRAPWGGKTASNGAMVTGLRSSGRRFRASTGVGRASSWSIAAGGHQRKQAAAARAPSAAAACRTEASASRLASRTTASRPFRSSDRGLAKRSQPVERGSVRRPAEHERVSP